MVGLVVPSTDENLLNSSGTAAASPFVIAASRAGIKIVPSIINAVVLTSAWSSGNSGLLNSSRTLYGLAQEGRAFKIFKRTNRLGIPYVAVGFMSLFICLGYMTLVRNSLSYPRDMKRKSGWIKTKKEKKEKKRNLTLPTSLVVTKRFNSLHLAPRSRLSIHPRELDRHLHRLSPILLRHEKTKHQPKSTSLEKSLAALSRLDYRSIFYSSSLDWRLHHFSPRTVSFSLSLDISYIWKRREKSPTARQKNFLTKSSWSTETFISSYINIPIVILAYFIYKFIFKTQILSLEKVPVLRYIEIAEQNLEAPAVPVTGWRRLNILWS